MAERQTVFRRTQDWKRVRFEFKIEEEREKRRAQGEIRNEKRRKKGGMRNSKGAKKGKMRNEK